MAPIVKDKKIFIGGTLIVVGMLLFLHKTHIVDFPHGIFSWPTILLWAGALAFLTSDNRQAGIVLMAIGGFFLLQRFFWPLFIEIRDFWPLFIVLAGVIMILKRRSLGNELGDRDRKRLNDPSGLTGDYLNETAIFGGGDHKVMSDNFKGGSITAIFGGSKIDLSETELAEGTNILEATAIFGGWELTVPSHWKIEMDVTPILGGFSDNRKLVAYEMTDNTRKLIIKGFVMFGGGEVSSAKK